MLGPAAIPQRDPFGRNPFSAIHLGSKPSPRFRTDWAWSPSGPGTAHVTASVTPTVAAQLLKFQARLPIWVDLVSGETSRVIESPLANVPVRMDFDLAFPSDRKPVVVTEILLVIAEGNQDVHSITAYDSATPLTERSPIDWPSADAVEPLTSSRSDLDTAAAAPPASSAASTETGNVALPIAVGVAAVLLLLT